MANKNLSEVLFKPTFNDAETSTLVSNGKLANEYRPMSWYRVLNRLEWAWRDIDFIESNLILSRIATSDALRSNPDWLDTVIGYHSGNWCYEWCRRGAYWQKKVLTTQGDKIHQQSAEYWLRASSLYSLASFPHLKGDKLAFQAANLAANAYKQAGHRTKFLKELTFYYHNKPIQALLHLPDVVDKPCPTIMVCGGLGEQAIDYYRLFELYLKPAGFAMLTIDNPGVGNNERWRLTQNTSELHEFILTELASVPWIDHQNIALIGFRFGANIATRLAYIKQNSIKALICVSPILHQLFVNQELQKTMSLMYKDILINRIGFGNVSDERLRAELYSFSLKTQGLLGRGLSVPTLAISVKHVLSHLREKDDLSLLMSSCHRGKVIESSAAFLAQKNNLALLTMIDWLKDRLV